jgi:hypothetical protein
MKKRIGLILLLILLILPASWFLFKPGFFVSDDGEWMVIRLTDFHRSLVSGMIPVRWAARLNFSYGYPVFNFLYPLSLYLGELFYLFGFSAVWSIKLVFIFSFFLSGMLMYLFGRELWGRPGGLLTAVFYTYAPYRFVDVYVRGSIGEALGFVFAPLIFLSLFSLYQKRSKIWLGWGAVGLAGLIMSHNIMAMLFLPVILAFAGLLVFLPKLNKELFFRFIILFLLGLGLACFFWLPALLDKQFTFLDQISVTNYWEHFPNLKQLLIPSWGYGPSLSSDKDAPSYQIGLFNLLGVMLSFIILLKAKAKKPLLIFFLLVFGITFLLMLPIAKPIWDFLPLIKLSQFPWRLLSVTTFTSSILTGSLVYLYKPASIKWLVAILLALVIGFNYSYARPTELVNRPESFYTTNEATTTVKDEYLPIWAKQRPPERAQERVVILEGEGEIKNLVFNSKKTKFELAAATPVKAQVNQLYFPGWQVKVNGHSVPIAYNNSYGLIQFEIAPGDSLVLAEFKETPLRLTADMISLLSLGIVVGLVIRKNGKSKKEN